MNKEERKEYMRKYNRKPETKLKKKGWVNNNKEKVSKQQKDWRKNNPNYDKKWIENNGVRKRELLRKATSKYAKNNYLKCNARSKVYGALKSGKLIKPDSCEKCGRRLFLHAHHEDYLKPLNVNWLCVTCHRDIHK